MDKHYYLNLEKINSIMLERGISEEWLAEEIGVAKNRLHGYLTQYRTKVPFKIFTGLSVILNISLNEIITTTLPSP